MEDNPTSDPVEYAYYSPDWIWPNNQSDLMKSMLLFFDRIALALPEKVPHKQSTRDLVLATPLAERGLLVNFDPARELDTRTAKSLAITLTQLVETVRFSHRSHERMSAYHYGFAQAPATVNEFEKILQSRGLMNRVGHEGCRSTPCRETSCDGCIRTSFESTTTESRNRSPSSYRFHGTSNILAGYPRRLLYLWFQSTRPDEPRASRIRSLLDVGADLSDVPLDEVLAFRKQNGSRYIDYATDLRSFLTMQALLSPTERRQAQLDRRLQFREQAAELVASLVQPSE